MLRPLYRWSGRSAHLTGTDLRRGPFRTVPQGEDREETHACAGSSHDWGSSVVFERWIELSGNNRSACGCFLCFHVFGLRGRLKATSEGVWSPPHRDMDRIDRHCIHTSIDQHEFHHSDPTTLDDNVVVSYLFGTSKHCARQHNPILAHREPNSVEALNPALHSSIGKSSWRNSATRGGCDHPHSLRRNPNVHRSRACHSQELTE